MSRTFRNKTEKRRFLALTICAFGVIASPMWAADITWDGSDNNQWSQKNNWTPNNNPTTADTAIFATKGSIVNPLLNNNTASVLGVDFTGTGGWTITSSNQANNLLTVGTGGIDQSGSGLNTVAAGVALAASGTWTVSSGTLSITGNITGSSAFGLTKAGAGTLTVSGSNAYLGATTVSAGTFFIDGNQTAATGAVNVNAGTLGGDGGTIGGATTIANLATLAPGKNGAANVLTFASSLNFSGTDSKVVFDIAGTNRGVGGGYDAINTTGLLTYGGDMTLNITSVIADGTTFDLFALSGGQAGTFDSIAFSGGIYTSSWANQGGGIWKAADSGKFFTFNEATGDLTVVPEPASVALFVVGAFFVMMRIRRQKFSGLKTT
jgi:autotransporter-associated beta strand protein